MPERPFSDDFAAVEGSFGDPLELFARWFSEAEQSEPADANAMTLATVDRAHRPEARTVLLKGYDHRGFVFYTNLNSAKAQALSAHPEAACLFFWKSLDRQVRIQGRVAAVVAQEADAYFRTRSRASQLGAWASPQSEPLAGGRAELFRLWQQKSREYEGRTIPRPSNWSGFRLVPRRFEFWRAGEARLHHRLVYERKVGDGQPSSWQHQVLAP